MVCIMASHPAKMQVTCTATIYRWLLLLLHHVPLASLTIWFPHVDTIMVGHLFRCNRTNIYQGCHFSLLQGNLAIKAIATLWWKSRCAYFFFGFLCVGHSFHRMNAFTIEALTRNHIIYFHAFFVKWPTMYSVRNWSWWSTPFMYWLYNDKLYGWLTCTVWWPTRWLACTIILGSLFVLSTLTGFLSCHPVATRFVAPYWNVLCSPCIIFPGFFTLSGICHLFCQTVPQAYILCCNSSLNSGTDVNKLSKYTW